MNAFIYEYGGMVYPMRIFTNIVHMVWIYPNMEVKGHLTVNDQNIYVYLVQIVLGVKTKTLRIFFFIDFNTHRGTSVILCQTVIHYNLY